MTKATNSVSEAIAHKEEDKDPAAIIMRKGAQLYRMGEELNGIYLLNSGAIKLYRTTEAGEEQIVGFCMPGELIGLDAMEDGVSRSTAVAMDTSNLTLISFNSLAKNMPGLNFGAIIHKIGATLNRECDHSFILSQRTADRRLAWFLVEFSDSLVSRGLCPTEFSLPMKRTDLALFLGLAVETVCRELANFTEAGWIRKDRRRFVLLDLPMLRKVANGEDDERPDQTISIAGHAA